MSRDVIESILNQVRNLTPSERVAVADEVDRLAWRDRVQTLVDDVSSRCQDDSITDEEIDSIVNDVRTETPLYERYWIRRRRRR